MYKIFKLGLDYIVWVQIYNGQIMDRIIHSYMLNTVQYQVNE